MVRPLTPPVTLVVFYFLFLSIGFMSGSAVITKVGGYFGILVGSWGYILGMETLYMSENNIFKLPVSFPLRLAPSHD